MSDDLSTNLNEDSTMSLKVYRYRHPSTRHMMKMLDPNPNLPEHLLSIAEDIFMLAHNIVLDCRDTPELTAGLRKLLEAKDSLVRARLDSGPPSYTDR